jgi:hypothetical protein
MLRFSGGVNHFKISESYPQLHRISYLRLCLLSLQLWSAFVGFSPILVTMVDFGKAEGTRGTSVETPGASMDWNVQQPH